MKALKVGIGAVRFADLEVVSGRLGQPVARRARPAAEPGRRSSGVSSLARLAHPHGAIASAVVVAS